MEAALVKHYRAADAAGKNMIRTMAKLAASAQVAEDGVRQMTHEPASVRAVRRDAYREQTATEELANFLENWCRGRGSNPHAPFGTRDFKSRASASSATPACNGINSLRWLLRRIRALVHAFFPCDKYCVR